MNFKLNLKGELSWEIRRVICEEGRNAVEHINNSEPHLAVHEVRKSFKRIRAALRLARYNITFYPELNKFFRDESRRIAELRDASAVIESWDKIVQRYSGFYSRFFSTFKKDLLKYRDRMTKECVERQQRLVQIKVDLNKKLKEIESRDFEASDFSDIQPGLKTVYKRGLKAFVEAKLEGNDADFHDWRKRAKYLGYQLELLNDIWPRYLSRLENELHELTDCLGLDHDLVVLNNMILEGKVKFKDKATKSLFLTLVTAEQEQMRKKALLKGTKLYIDSPAEFCSKMDVYWKTFKKENYDPKLMN